MVGDGCAAGERETLRRALHPQAAKPAPCPGRVQRHPKPSDEHAPSGQRQAPLREDEPQDRQSAGMLTGCGAEQTVKVVKTAKMEGSGRTAGPGRRVERPGTGRTVAVDGGALFQISGELSANVPTGTNPQTLPADPLCEQGRLWRPGCATARTLRDGEGLRDRATQDPPRSRDAPS